MCFSFVKDHRAHPAPSGARRCKINSKAVWEIIPRTVPGFCSGLSSQPGRMMLQFERAGNGEGLENRAFRCILL